MEPRTGFEPVIAPWDATPVPNKTKKLNKKMEPRTGFEPVIAPWDATPVPNKTKN